MNQGQQLFHDFYMNLVREDKKEEAEALLSENFAKQDDGSFTPEYFLSVKDKYFELIQPENAEALQKAMTHFSSNL